MGLVHFAYRCDREAALNAMVDDAIARAGRTGKRIYTDQPPDDIDESPTIAEEDEPDAPTYVPQTPTAPFATIAVPELTHPGESASNGRAERSVRTLEEQVRTMLTALEARIHMAIPSSHPILGWVVQHAAYILNKYQHGIDKGTPFARLHGKETSEKLVEFGKRYCGSSPRACGRNWIDPGDTVSGWAAPLALTRTSSAYLGERLSGLGQLFDLYLQLAGTPLGSSTSNRRRSERTAK